MQPAEAASAKASTQPSVAETGAALPATSAPTTPASAPVAAAQASSPAQAPAPLATQLTGQLTHLRQLPQGDHVMTLTVNPETFGPVRVVAHISHEGVHLELFGASDQARAALRAALPDLRRDLAGLGLEPRLDLGSQSQSGQQGQQSALGDPNGFGPRSGRGGTSTGTAAHAVPASSTSPHLTRSTHTGAIDVDL